MRPASLVLLALAAVCPPLTASAQPSAFPDSLLDGLPFRSIGPAVMSGRVVDLAVVETDPYVFYVASATGGLWKTRNNGVTFTSLFENEGSHSIGAIAVHQRDTSLVWVGTGERANRQSTSWGDGVYKSTDGGRSWTHMGLPDTHHIGRIVLHPDTPDMVYVAAMGHLWGPNEERGLYKSTDGGQTWERVLYIDEDTGVVDVAMHPSEPDVLFAAAYQRRRRPYGFDGGGPGSGLYKSTDGGQTWTELTEGLPAGEKGRIGIAIYRGDPRIVYVCVEQGYRYNASTAYTERRGGIFRSDDGGATWQYRGDWNPRPMYASQIQVDPNDPDRVYMMNAFSYSDDGGATFEEPRQSLHGDDRIVWINPADSRHLIKGDDGGVGISYDRGRTWLYVTSLPISQFYRVSVDLRDPYRVYGGLQDNGSWAGPNATYREEGILNADWIKTGGGDGFVNIPHPSDPATLYTESQYLGLSRLDLETGERRSIRPGDPKGRIAGRRNWDAWGPGTPEPELGNAMAPANWDGPFIVSHHTPHTLYAGTNILWKSLDGGDSWTPLGDLTSGVNRRELPIMGRRAHDTTPSLDDGVPYYPTLTSIAESPIQPGLLYAGTDDGMLQVSFDDGATWQNVADRLPDAPANAWVSDIEVSRFYEGTVYAVLNNYRNDDFGNYLYHSPDNGATWSSIAGDLPPDRVLRTLREDPRNPDVLYLGTEFGLFVSLDRGEQWIPFTSNLPLQPINDLLVHPRDNDLVLATHGRGIWILDQVNALQELSPNILDERAFLFSVEPARMIRYQSDIGHTGDLFFAGDNPPAGAVIDYYLRDLSPRDGIDLSIYDPHGTRVATLEPETEAGLHRVVWDLRYPALPPPVPDSDDEEESGPRSGPDGPFVVPGRYTARLTVGGETRVTTVLVHDDPRLDLPVEDRAAWTRRLLEIGDFYRAVRGDAAVVVPVHAALRRLVDDGLDVDAGTQAEIEETHRLFTELASRVLTLYRQVENWTGRLTEDQESQLAYYRDVHRRLFSRKQSLVNDLLPRLNEGLPVDRRISLEG